MRGSTVKLSNSEAAFREQVQELLKELRPGHDAGHEGELQIERLNTAMTNRVYYLKTPSSKYVLRIYGDALPRLLSSSSELSLMHTLAEMGKGPRVLMTFGNGRIEEYIEGRTMKVREIRDRWKEIAVAMAEVHGMQADNIRGAENVIWERIYRWRRESAKMLLLDSDSLLPKLGRLQKEMEVMDMRMCFCHNDLQHGNIMVEKNKVLFVDYEYAGTGYAAYDIANHWCEWMADYDSVPVLNKACYPSAEEQSAFVNTYNANSCTTKVTVEQVNSCVAMSHVYWAYWAHLQSSSANFSNASFDYKLYAEERFKAYADSIGEYQA